MYAWTGENAIRVLTFERGVEDYTLACGTGTASTACVLWAEGKLPGCHVMAENQGGMLEVTLETRGDEITAIYLEGPTEVVKVYEL